MSLNEAWNEWWEHLGHVSRCNRDPARTREAFEAGYLAALAIQGGKPAPSSPAQAFGTEGDFGRDKDGRPR